MDEYGRVIAIIAAGERYGITIESGRYDTEPYTVYVQGQYAYETFRYDHAVQEVYRHLPADVAQDVDSTV